MPGFVNENESESRQSLYKALLDNLNPMLTMGETASELSYRPSEEELKSNSIEFGPKGQKLPRTVAGKISRFVRKAALDPLYSGANALSRAYEGKATMQDAAEASLTALSGGTLGGGSGVANQIRGVPKDIAKAIRRAMQNEFRMRGPRPFEKVSPHDPIKLSENIESYKELLKNPTNKYSDEYKLAIQDEIAYLKSLHSSATQKEDAIASKLLRGTWYRGQEEYPQILGKEKLIDPSTGKEVEELLTRQFGKEYAGESPTFMGMRASSSNVGEPHGISLSYDPNVSVKFNAPNTIELDELSKDYKPKLQKLISEDFKNQVEYEPTSFYHKAKKLSQTHKVGRAMPLYGGPPEDKILMAWKPEHGAEFRSAYVEAAQEMSGKYPGFKRKLESLEPGASGESVKNMIDYDPNKDAWQKDSPLQVFNTDRYKSNRDEFNSIMSRILRERGWKGMLHSPHRYQEYELRMFDPYDVMHIDKRAVTKYSEDNPMASQGVKRLHEMKRPLKIEHEAVTEGKPKSLGEFYRDITREELLGQPKVKGIPSKPKEYDFELDLNDINLDFNDTTTKLLQSTEQAHELTKAKLKSVTDKAKGYIEKAQAKKDFEKALGHNAEINDFEEVWESYKELGKTKTSFKDFISDW